MSYLTSVAPRPRAAGFGREAWAASFPLVAELWRELLKAFVTSYRPELHYMRGPGPRWREKHATASPHGAAPAGGESLARTLETNAPGMFASRPGAPAAGRPPRPAALPSTGLVPRAGRPALQTARVAARARASTERRHIAAG